MSPNRIKSQLRLLDQEKSGKFDREKVQRYPLFDSEKLDQTMDNVFFTISAY